MCGITGYWNLLGAKRDAFQSELHHAITSLSHRGPDDSGLWIHESKQLGLGHARLSVLDLSQYGHQPMRSADGRFVLVFNGEIYNFSEIRKNLKKGGHHFLGTGDTEVLLAAFGKWGQGCVQHFAGMFAFAIWDMQINRLSLCRDRVGVKPLYYGWDGKVFWFGSELKALRTYEHWVPETNRQALGEFFQYGYIAGSRTIYRNIFKLQPGHWLDINLINPQPRIYSYWSLQDIVAQGPLDGSEEALTDQLEELLLSACQYRMVADVPVGVFLSGGVDSSVVASLLQKHANYPIHTFTIGFKDKAHDESVWARKIANHLGTEHTEYILDLNKARDLIPALPIIYDEPFGDPSGIATAMVSALAREQVTVALSADGGDELFAGYSEYHSMATKLSNISSNPPWLRSIVGHALHALPLSLMTSAIGKPGIPGITLPGRILRKLIKLRNILPDASRASVFHSSILHFMPEEVDKLIGGYEDPRCSLDNYMGVFEEQMTQWDFEHYLSDDILAKVDRATMHVGLEGREPLLDHRVVEFAFRLPIQLRIGVLGQKHLLRKVLYRYVPRELIDRPKRGFAVPVKAWLKENDGALVENLNKSNGLYSVGIDPILVKREVDLFNKIGNNEMRIWLLFVLDQWAAKWT